MAGVRKLFRMTRGASSAPLHAVIKDDLETGYTPLIKTVTLNSSAVGNVFEDLIFPMDVSLMGGGFAVTGDNDGDVIKFIIAPNTPYQYEVVNAEIHGMAGHIYWREIGDLKQGGTKISAGTALRLQYTNVNGAPKKFVPNMEFAW